MSSKHLATLLFVKHRYLEMVKVSNVAKCSEDMNKYLSNLITVYAGPMLLNFRV